MTTPMVLDDAALYGLSDVDCEFCLATHKPGPCARPHVNVPAAPPPKSLQQAAQEHATDQNYTAAISHAEQLAQQLGANMNHARVQAAIRDYARAHAQHQQAVATADRARAVAQKAHDTAVAKNQAIDKANAAAQAAFQAQQVAAQHRAALAAAAKAHSRGKPGQKPAPGPRPVFPPAPPAHHSLDSDLYGQLHVDMLYAVVSSAHWWCSIGEFCRNPLHPGPCKGWKHMLHSIAPGAYHAYEKQRVAKLNEKRKAKIAELEAAGKKIPAYLKKEITYQQVPTPPPIGSATKWNPVSREAAMAKMEAKELAGLQKDIKAGFHTPESAQSLAKGIAGQAIPPGAKVYSAGDLTIVDKLGNTPADVIAAAKDELSSLNATDPLPGGIMVHFTGEQMKTGDATSSYIGILLGKGIDNGPHSELYGSALMPSAKGAGRVRYAIAHEYGHAIMQKNQSNAAAQAMYAEHKGDLSVYGKHDNKEAYAEAFAEWHLTNGKTDNPAVRAYAKKFGWGKTASTFTAPTPKEAQAALPATAKEIGAKIAMKHAQIAEQKLAKLREDQSAAFVAMIEHHSPLSSAQKAVMLAKVKSAFDSLKPGEKPSDHPLVANTLKMIADKAAIAAHLDGPQHTELLNDIRQHVDEGVGGLPLLLTSAKNHAEKLKKDAADAATYWQKAKDLEAENKLAAEKAATAQKLKYLLAHNYATYWQKASQADRDAAIASLKEAISSGHLELGDKLKANAMIATISEVSAQEAKKSSIPGVTGELKKTGQQLGTHGAQVAVDEAGKKFLAKPHASYGDFTSHGEVGASQLAKAVGLPTPEVHLTKDGTVQEMVPGAKDAFPGKNFDPSKLSDKDILDIQKHHVLDWLIGNHDAHPGNFLRDEHGNLVEIDKGQAFKHFHEDKLSANYHPNAAYGEQEPVYNTLLKAASTGQIELNDPKTGELHDFIQKVQNLPDAQVKDMFRPYAEAAAKAGQLPGAPNGGKTGSGAVSAVAVDGFLDELIKRKKTLGPAFAYLHSKHTPTAPKVAESAPKVTGPVAHPDMMEAAGILKPGSGWTTGEKLHTLNQPGVNKAEFEKLSPATQQTIKNELAKMHDQAPASVENVAHKLGIDKIDIVAPGGSIAPAAPLAHDVPAHVKHAQSLATGATYGTSKAKLAAYDKLSQAEFHSLPLHVQEAIQNDLHEAHGKFLDPGKKAAVAQVQHKLGMPKAPAGAGAPHHEPAAPVHAPAPGTTHVQNQAKAYQAIAKLSGTTSGISKNTQLLEKFFTDAQGDKPVIAPALNHMLSDWSQKHLDGLPLTPEEKNAITEKARAEMLQMVMGGTVTPPGGGVLHVSEAAGPHSPETVAAVMKGAAGIPVKSVVNPPQAGAGGPAKIPTKVVTAKAPGLGKGTSTAKITASAKSSLLAAYKGQPGTYLSSPVEDNYQAVLNVAHAHTGKPGFGSLSLSQVIDSIDEAQAKKLSVSNTGMLKKKITDWLATPEGKAAAQALTPNEAQVKALQSGIMEPVKLPKGKKVPKPGGPGPFDKNAKSTDFKALTHGEILKIQKDYQEQTGTHWTPSQLSAIKTYTSSSDSINGYLRGEHAGYGDDAQQAAHLQQAMMPIQEDVKLSRGTGWEFVPPQYRSYEGMQKLIGKTISDKAFLSTATAGESQGFGSKDVQIQIEAPKGTMGIYVEHVTSVTEEYEVILAAGTKLKVTGVSKDGYKTVVKARVVS